MKRTLITAMVAALFIPVGFAAPAHANADLIDDIFGDPSYDVAMSIENTSGDYPIWAYGTVDCGEKGGMSVLGSPSEPVMVNNGDFNGMVPKCDLYVSGDPVNYEFTATANGITVHCTGSITAPKGGVRPKVTYGGDTPCTWVGKASWITNFVDVEAIDASQPINIKVKPGYAHENSDLINLGTEPLTGVNAATNVNTADTRSKNTNYVTLHPNRVTAMAKRFVDEPNSPINIHGYGPDKGVALARANHIRDHLISEIIRLGGDPANYPTFVVYGGDPDHKKGVHVTIHQHAASSITVPEGGTLTIGGNS